AAAAWRLGLPVVAKWSRPWLLPPGSGLRSTVLVRSAREARELYSRREEAGSTLLLQAFLPPGPDRDWFFHGYADRAGGVRAGGGHGGRPLGAEPEGADAGGAAHRRAGLSRHPRSGLPPLRGHRRLPPARLQPPSGGAVPAVHRHGGAGRGPGAAPGPDAPSA